MAEEDDLDPEALEGGQDGEDGEGGESSGGGFDAKKIILFVVVPVFLLIAVGGGLYFSGILDKLMGGGAKTEETAEHSEDEHGDNHKETHSTGAYFLEIPNMIVNLGGGDGDTRYLRLTVHLELKSEKDLTAVQAVVPRVVDQFQTYLRELRVSDLRGSQGLYRLQTELLARVNAAAYPIEVQDVLFQEILIQ